jgi:predicted RNA-binding protein Jag
LKSNSATQVRDALTRIYGVDKRDDTTTRALAEAAAAIKAVKTTLRPVEISPQNAYLRRLQHQLVSENDLSARSTGKEPQRRLRITPTPEETLQL